MRDARGAWVAGLSFLFASYSQVLFILVISLLSVVAIWYNCTLVEQRNTTLPHIRRNRKGKESNNNILYRLIYTGHDPIFFCNIKINKSIYSRGAPRIVHRQVEQACGIDDACAYYYICSM